MTRRNTGRNLSATFIAGLFLSALVSQTAFAESACKGLEKPACEAKDACHWVDGYTRKDGVKVSAHCRKSPTHKGSLSTSSSTKSPSSTKNSSAESASSTSSKSSSSSKDSKDSKDSK